MFRAKYSYRIVLKYKNIFQTRNFYLSLSNSVEPISLSEEHHQNLLLTPPKQPQNPKVLKVSVLGMPNAGKSSLINALMNREILPTSQKIDTTKDNASTILTVDDTQIIIQDAPGIHGTSKGRKLKIDVKRTGAPSRSYSAADLGLVIADLSSRRIRQGFLQPEVLHTLINNKHVPSVLVLNKVDILSSDEKLLQIIYLLTSGKVNESEFAPKKIELKPLKIPKINQNIINEYVYDEFMATANNHNLNKLRRCRGWPHFKDVFVVSAKKNIKIDVLLKYLLNQAKPGTWVYDKNLKVTTGPKQCTENFIQAAMLECIPNEIPYFVKTCITNWETSHGRLVADVDIICPSKYQAKYLTRNIKKIALLAQNNLQNVFFTEVFLRLNIIVH